jgi:RimJ/RimL family protein N-acetyltransferase
VNWPIRRLGPDDVTGYREIRAEALAQHPDAFGTSVAEFAGRSNEDVARMLQALAVYAAEGPDGKLGGLAAFERDVGVRAAHRGWLMQVYVRPAHRGTGLGEALVERIIEHARHHVVQVHLGVSTENQPALELYRRCGFSIYGTDPRYLYVNGRYIDEHLMVRFLDKAPGDQK